MQAISHLYSSFDNRLADLKSTNLNVKINNNSVNKLNINKTKSKNKIENIVNCYKESSEKLKIKNNKNTSNKNSKSKSNKNTEKFSSTRYSLNDFLEINKKNLINVIGTMRTESNNNNSTNISNNLKIQNSINLTANNITNSGNFINSKPMNNLNLTNFSNPNQNNVIKVNSTRNNNGNYSIHSFNFPKNQVLNNLNESSSKVNYSNRNNFNFNPLFNETLNSKCNNMNINNFNTTNNNHTINNQSLNVSNNLNPKNTLQNNIFRNKLNSKLINDNHSLGYINNNFSNPTVLKSSFIMGGIKNKENFNKSINNKIITINSNNQNYNSTGVENFSVCLEKNNQPHLEKMDINELTRNTQEINNIYPQKNNTDKVNYNSIYKNYNSSNPVLNLNNQHRINQLFVKTSQIEKNNESGYLISESNQKVNFVNKENNLNLRSESVNNIKIRPKSLPYKDKRANSHLDFENFNILNNFDFDPYAHSLERKYSVEQKILTFKNIIKNTKKLSMNCVKQKYEEMLKKKNFPSSLIYKSLKNDSSEKKLKKSTVSNKNEQIPNNINMKNKKSIEINKFGNFSLINKNNFFYPISKNTYKSSNNNTKNKTYNKYSNKISQRSNSNVFNLDSVDDLVLTILKKSKVIDNFTKFKNYSLNNEIFNTEKNNLLNNKKNNLNLNLEVCELSENEKILKNSKSKNNVNNKSLSKNKSIINFNNNNNLNLIGKDSDKDIKLNYLKEIQGNFNKNVQKNYNSNKSKKSADKSNKNNNSKNKSINKEEIKKNKIEDIHFNLPLNLKIKNIHENKNNFDNYETNNINIINNNAEYQKLFGTDSGSNNKVQHNKNKSQGNIIFNSNNLNINPNILKNLTNIKSFNNTENTKVQSNKNENFEMAKINKTTKNLKDINFLSDNSNKGKNNNYNTINNNITDHSKNRNNSENLTINKKSENNNTNKSLNELKQYLTTNENEKKSNPSLNNIFEINNQQECNTHYNFDKNIKVTTKNELYSIKNHNYIDEKISEICSKKLDYNKNSNSTYLNKNEILKSLNDSINNHKLNNSKSKEKSSERNKELILKEIKDNINYNSNNIKIFDNEAEINNFISNNINVKTENFKNINKNNNNHNFIDQSFQSELVNTDLLENKSIRDISDSKEESILNEQMSQENLKTSNVYNYNESPMKKIHEVSILSNTIDDIEDMNTIIKKLNYKEIELGKENIFSLNNKIYNEFNLKFKNEFEILLFPKRNQNSSIGKKDNYNNKSISTQDTSSKKDVSPNKFKRNNNPEIIDNSREKINLFNVHLSKI